MFGKNKENNTPVTNESGEKQFEKNIKTLWIYTGLFCAFALVLIAVSSIIQGKIHSEAEYYQDQYESAQTSNQSTIKNIQDENNALKRDLATYKSKVELMEDEYLMDMELLNNANALIENAEYLLLAKTYYEDNKKADAADQLQKVDPNILSPVMNEIYTDLKERLD